MFNYDQHLNQDIQFLGTSCGFSLLGYLINIANRPLTFGLSLSVLNSPGQCGILFPKVTTSPLVGVNVSFGFPSSIISDDSSSHS